jgi:hypothetical protein
LPWAVPVTPLFLALPMTLLMSAREWRSIDLSGFALITAGRLLGTVAGVVLLVLAPKGYLSIVTGLLILTIALGSFLKPTFEVNKRSRLAGGVSSGVVSTVAALGARVPGPLGSRATVDTGHLVRGGNRHVACWPSVGRQGPMAARCLSSRIVAGAARWFVGQPVGRRAPRRALVAPGGVGLCGSRRSSNYPPRSWRLKAYRSLWRGSQPAAFKL